MSMTCTQCEEAYSAGLDGALSPPARVEMERHLAGCARCREEVARLRNIDAALAAWPAPDVPLRADARFAEGCARRAASRRPSIMPYAWQRGFALAAVFVLCCLGGWLLHGRFASPPVSPATQIAAPPRLPQSGSVEAPVSVAERQPAPAPAMPPAPVVATPERPDAVTVTPGAMEDRCDDTPPVVEPDHYALLGEAPVTPAVMDEPMTGSQDAPAPVSPDCAVVAMLAETGY